MRRAFPWLPNGAHKTTFRLHRRNFGDAATHQPCPAPLRLCGGRLLGRLRFWLWRLARSTFVFLKNRRRLSARFRPHSSVGVKASLVYLSQTFSGPSCLLSRKSRPFSPLPSSSDTRRFQLFRQWAICIVESQTTKKGNRRGYFYDHTEMKSLLIWRCHPGEEEELTCAIRTCHVWDLKEYVSGCGVLDCWRMLILNSAGPVLGFFSVL